ncbi:Amuc_1099 family pilus-like system protein [Kiritimatiella glycovorans]|uniref:Uncharacterized protein n=1 Tax=Kiritimatiella glycovorans TaxID=1307763 RepID=A0A0G3EJ40_9BACT|nr:Amuc_1099 family pilus-like system protein [Kiritimatiella glycovorans]AKJ65452.1 hypothetical protein L21SP4_02225 [Kiritimatiella glycovorans]
MKGNFGWIARHYEKAALAAVIVLLAASALYGVMRIRGLRQEVRAAAWETPPAEVSAAAAVSQQRIRNAMETMTRDVEFKESGRPLFTSRTRVRAVGSGYPIPYMAEVCPFTGAEQPALKDPEKVDIDGDGMPDMYERENGFDPTVAADATRDADNDGFTNYEEYTAGTDPRDSSSFPPPVAKLRMVRRIETPFKFLFKSVTRIPDGSRVFALNLREGGRTHFVEIGQSVAGIEVKRYDEDKRTLYLEQAEKMIALEQGKEISSFEVKAGMIYLVDSRKLVKRVGETFTLKEKQYEVVEIRDEEVTVKAVETGRKSTVPKLTDAERRRLLTGE